MSSTNKQSGNVLFLILIAVALFAALSYAVTNSSKSGGSGVSDDKAKLAASTLAQFGSNIENAATRLGLMNRLSWSQIEYTGNNADCNDASCDLLEADGGGISLTVPNVVVDHAGSATARFRFIKIANVGSDLPELAIQVAGISNKVCRQVNKLMKIPSSIRADGIPFGEATTGGGGGHDVTWTYTSSSFDALSITNNPSNRLIADVGKPGSSPEVAGHRTFCICASNGTDCGSDLPIQWQRRFWHVVVAR